MGNNSKMGDNSDEKKNTGRLFFHENFKTLAYMVLSLCYAQESNNISWSDLQRAITPTTFHSIG